MGWLSQTLALLRARFSVILLTSALSILPANLLGAGAVRFGLGLLGGEGVGMQSAAVSDKERIRSTKVTPAEGAKTPEEPAIDWHTPGGLLHVAAASAVGLALLLLGLALAHAALVPVILGSARRPTEAWAVVAGRMGGLLVTGVQGALLIALGTILFLLPGIAAMLAFAFAVPAVVIEGLSGSAALDRSWRLIRGRLGAVLAMWLVIAA